MDKYFAPTDVKVLRGMFIKMHAGLYVVSSLSLGLDTEVHWKSPV
jgi:hypothetical protein